MTIGKRIRRARIDRKLTLDQVAAATGTTKQAVASWEKTGRPTADKLGKIREVLEVTYVWLVDGGNTPPPARDDSEVLIENRMVKLLRRESGTAA